MLFHVIVSLKGILSLHNKFLKMKKRHLILESAVSKKSGCFENGFSIVMAVILA